MNILPSYFKQYFLIARKLGNEENHSYHPLAITSCFSMLLFSHCRDEALLSCPVNFWAPVSLWLQLPKQLRSATHYHPKVNLCLPNLKNYQHLPELFLQLPFNRGADSGDEVRRDEEPPPSAMQLSWLFTQMLGIRTWGLRQCGKCCPLGYLPISSIQQFLQQ